MILYYAPRTRSTRCRWLLEELGAPYELVNVDMAKREHKTPAHLAIHPHGAVPALVDGDLTMIESSAICMYLADKFPEKKLAPALGSPDRGRYYQWMVYAIATMEPPTLEYFMHSSRLPENERLLSKAEAAARNIGDYARVVAAALGKNDHILGAEFSAADVMVGSILAWARAMKVPFDSPLLDAYVERVTARPAFKKA